MSDDKETDNKQGAGERSAPGYPQRDPSLLVAHAIQREKDGGSTSSGGHTEPRTKRECGVGNYCPIFLWAGIGSMKKLGSIPRVYKQPRQAHTKPHVHSGGDYA